MTWQEGAWIITQSPCLIRPPPPIDDQIRRLHPFLYLAPRLIHHFSLQTLIFLILIQAVLLPLPPPPPQCCSAKSYLSVILLLRFQAMPQTWKRHRGDWSNDCASNAKKKRLHGCYYHLPHSSCWHRLMNLSFEARGGALVTNLQQPNFCHCCSLKVFAWLPNSFQHLPPCLSH